MRVRPWTLHGNKKKISGEILKKKCFAVKNTFKKQINQIIKKKCTSFF